MSFQVDPAGPSQTVYTAAEVDAAIAAVSAPITSSHVTDFVEAAQDAVAAMLAAGTSIALSYDDTANTLTITDTGGGGLDAETVRDTIGIALVGAGLITVTVNDAADTITLSTTATANSSDAVLENRANHTGTQLASTISDFSTAADARIASATATGTGSLVRASAPTLVGPALGTPASGTLTNCTGLPLAGVADSTTEALGAGTLELGHASDTTVSRMEAGLIGVEGVNIPTITGAKRIAVVTSIPGSPDANTVYIINDANAPRAGTGTTSAGALSINLDLYDVFTATLTAATTLTFTGTFQHGQKALIEFVDNATPRAITWPSNTGDSGVATRPSTTVASKVHRVFLVYDANKSKLMCMAVDAVGY